VCLVLFIVYVCTALLFLGVIKDNNNDPHNAKPSDLALLSVYQLLLMVPSFTTPFMVPVV